MQILSNYARGQVVTLLTRTLVVTTAPGALLADQFLHQAVPLDVLDKAYPSVQALDNGALLLDMLHKHVQVYVTCGNRMGIMMMIMIMVMMIMMMVMIVFVSF